MKKIYFTENKNIFGTKYINAYYYNTNDKDLKKLCSIECEVEYPSVDAIQEYLDANGYYNGPYDFMLL